MKKQNYIVPVVSMVNVNMQHTLLAGSIGVSSTEYDSGTNGPIRSRGGSFWDDEDDEY